MSYSQSATGNQGQQTWEIVRRLGQGASGEVFEVCGPRGAPGVMKRPPTISYGEAETKAPHLRWEAQALRALQLVEFKEDDFTCRPVRLLDVSQAQSPMQYYIIQEPAAGFDLLQLTRAASGDLKHPSLNYDARVEREQEFLQRIHAARRIPRLPLLWSLYGALKLLDCTCTLADFRNGDPETAGCVGVIWNDVKPEHLFWDPATCTTVLIDWGNSDPIGRDGRSARLKLERWEDYQQYFHSFGRFLEENDRGLYRELSWPRPGNQEDALQHAASRLSNSLHAALRKERDELKKLRRDEERLARAVMNEPTKKADLAKTRDRLLAAGVYPNLAGQRLAAEQTLRRHLDDDNGQGLRSFIVSGAGLEAFGENIDLAKMLAALYKDTTDGNAGLLAACNAMLVEDWAMLLAYINPVANPVISEEDRGKRITPWPMLQRKILERAISLESPTLKQATEQLTQLVRTDDSQLAVRQMDRFSEWAKNLTKAINDLNSDSLVGEVTDNDNEKSTPSVYTALSATLKDMAKEPRPSTAIQTAVKRVQSILTQALAPERMFRSAWKKGDDLKKIRELLEKWLLWDSDRSALAQAAIDLLALQNNLERLQAARIPSGGRASQCREFLAGSSAGTLLQHIGPTEWLEDVVGAARLVETGTTPHSITPAVRQWMPWLDDNKASQFYEQYHRLMKQGEYVQAYALAASTANPSADYTYLARSLARTVTPIQAKEIAEAPVDVRVYSFAQDPYREEYIQANRLAQAWFIALKDKGAGDAQDVLRANFSALPGWTLLTALNGYHTTWQQRGLTPGLQRLTDASWVEQRDVAWQPFFDPLREAHQKWTKLAHGQALWSRRALQELAQKLREAKQNFKAIKQGWLAENSDALHVFCSDVLVQRYSEDSALDARLDKVGDAIENLNGVSRPMFKDDEFQVVQTSLNDLKNLEKFLTGQEKNSQAWAEAFETRKDRQKRSQPAPLIETHPFFAYLSRLEKRSRLPIPIPTPDPGWLFVVIPVMALFIIGFGLLYLATKGGSMLSAGQMRTPKQATAWTRQRIETSVAETVTRAAALTAQHVGATTTAALTATPSPLPGEPPTLTPLSESPAPGVVVRYGRVVSGQGAYCRAEPNIAAPVMLTFKNGEPVQVLGADISQRWVYGSPFGSPDLLCWVYRDLLEIDEQEGPLPVIAPSSTPSPTLTNTPVPPPTDTPIPPPTDTPIPPPTQIRLAPPSKATPLPASATPVILPAIEAGLCDSLRGNALKRQWFPSMNDLEGMSPEQQASLPEICGWGLGHEQKMLEIGLLLAQAEIRSHSGSNAGQRLVELFAVPDPNFGKGFGVDEKWLRYIRWLRAGLALCRAEDRPVGENSLGTLNNYRYTWLEEYRKREGINPDRAYDRLCANQPPGSGNDRRELEVPLLGPLVAWPQEESACLIGAADASILYRPLKSEFCPLPEPALLALKSAAGGRRPLYLKLSYCQLDDNAQPYLVVRRGGYALAGFPGAGPNGEPRLKVWEGFSDLPGDAVWSGSLDNLPTPTEGECTPEQAHTLKLFFGNDLAIWRWDDEVVRVMAATLPFDLAGLPPEIGFTTENVDQPGTPVIRIIELVVGVEAID